ncbi:MAG: glycosyl transferase GT17 family protein [Lachnospiraceae bacterium]|nr:glycosyl transferase GT17 family protein [Lachnospiraceae bacterium]
MIYDCFQFFNELDILYLRMKIMDSIVDRFVVSEATTTFSSLPKPLYFQENREMFKEFEEKIIHVVVEDTPPGDTHVRDTFQKSAVGRGLKDCRDDDIIIFSDLDEIPNPEKIKEILPNFQDDKIYHFAQRLFYCYLNMEEVSGKLLSYAGEFEGVEKKQWIGSKMCRYKLLKDQNLQLGDLRFPERKACGIRVAEGGWHFGYMGGKGETDIRKRVQTKVISAAHQEYNNKEVLNDVADKIKDGKDIFGRDARFVLRTIDETYPEYIRTHQKELAHLIMQEESAGEKAKRQRKRQLRKVGEKAVRGVKKIGRIVTGRN